MPLATPDTQHSPPFDDICEHCRASITWHASDPWNGTGQWRHDYPGHWYGQMICDPQQARAALQGRQPHHATP